MRYTHGGGIDRPLVITKGTTSIIPHQNWRGQFARGTWGVNSSNAVVGAKTECANSGSTGCLGIPWPGQRTNVRHALSDTEPIQNWFGGLVDGLRDASGQMYMRNRYYDPASGQFTQPDPIGLAGGLNAYGFAAGDPVTYSDPYGLRVEFQRGADGDRLRRVWDETREQARTAMGSEDPQVAAAGRVLFNSMRDLEDSDFVLEVGTYSDYTDRPAVGSTRSEWQGGRLQGNTARMAFSVHPDRQFFGNSPTFQVVTLAHEVGHAWTMMNFAQSQENDERFSDANANNHENAARRITGCEGYRPTHNVGGTRC